MIIDGHCHAGLGDGLSGPWDTRASLGAYLRRARAAGISQTVVFPPFHSDYRQANRILARTVARHQPRLIGFAALHPVRDAGRLARLVAEARSAFGCRGLKVHRMDAPASREVCAVARRFGLPVIYDVAGEVWRADLVAEEYPDVAFVLPHLGSFGDDWRAHTHVIDLMTRRENVYADTSGVRRFDFLLRALRRAGPHKLIFGSDGPWLHPAVELHKVRCLGLDAADEALVLGGNLLRLMTPARQASTAPAPPRQGSATPTCISCGEDEGGDFPWD